MSKKAVLIIAVSLLLTASLAYPGIANIVQAYSGIPTFNIQSVVTDSTVTIYTYNFPANDSFTVTMGPYGSLGIGGMVVATTNSGSGGSFQVTYSIPDGLKGSSKIAIRLQSPTSGYYAYNWFVNNTTTTATPTPTGATATPLPPQVIPTFNIQSVVTDSTVTIYTYNFPANDSYTVTMGPYGGLGIGGTVVATTGSGSGGSFAVTYSIPDGLKGSSKIAIRLQSPTTGYFAYNWFWNNTSSTVATAVPTATPMFPGYVGYPSFSISSVVRDSTVTIYTYNFPANDTYTVTMGPYGSLGIGGTVVATTSSGSGGSFTATYSIPDGLKGSSKIAIRLQSTISPYFAYNWFWNNTAPLTSNFLANASPPALFAAGYFVLYSYLFEGKEALCGITGWLWRRLQASWMPRSSTVCCNPSRSLSRSSRKAPGSPTG